MKDLDKKSNTELSSIKKELSDKYEEVRLELLKLYDYWESIQSDYTKVNTELRKRGLS